MSCSSRYTAVLATVTVSVILMLLLLILASLLLPYTIHLQLSFVETQSKVGLLHFPSTVRLIFMREDNQPISSEAIKRRVCRKKHRMWARQRFPNAGLGRNYNYRSRARKERACHSKIPCPWLANTVPA